VGSLWETTTTDDDDDGKEEKKAAIDEGAGMTSRGEGRRRRSGKHADYIATDRRFSRSCRQDTGFRSPMTSPVNSLLAQGQLRGSSGAPARPLFLGRARRSKVCIIRSA
jgi:hypothetical protein